MVKYLSFSLFQYWFNFFISYLILRLISLLFWLIECFVVVLILSECCVNVVTYIQPAEGDQSTESESEGKGEGQKEAEGQKDGDSEKTESDKKKVFCFSCRIF